MKQSVNVIKEIVKGLVISGLIISVVYFVYLFSFYELHLQCKLIRDNIYFEAEKIRHEADQKAEEMLRKRKNEAYIHFLSTVKKEIPKLWRARKKGFMEFLKAYLKCKKVIREAKKKYKMEVKKAEKEALRIKKQTREKIANLLQKSTKELNPLFLILKSKYTQGEILGYKYDPKKGEIIPNLNK